MNDWFIGAIHIFALVFVFSLGWIVSASTIGDECKKLNMFYVGEKVYECKLKEKTT